MTPFDLLRARLTQVRNHVLSMGWADHIYAPHCPLVVTDIFSENLPGSRDEILGKTLPVRWGQTKILGKSLPRRAGRKP